MTADVIIDAHEGSTSRGGARGPLATLPGVHRRHVGHPQPLRPLAPHVHAWAPVVSGGIVAVALGSSVLVTTVVLTVWLLVHLASHPRRLAGGAPGPVDAAHRAAASLGAATVLVVVGGLPQAALADALVVVTAGAGAALMVPAVTPRRTRRRRVLVVADPAHVGQLAAWDRATDLEVAGVVEVDAGTGGVPDGRPRPLVPAPRRTVVDLATTVTSEVERLGVQAVVVLPSGLVGPTDVRRLAWALEGTGVALAVCTGIGGAAPRRLTVSPAGHHTLVEIAPSRAPVHVRAVKCVTDRVAAAVLLVLLAPLLVAMVGVVRLESRGPGLFTQTRIGRHGRPFRLYKLRTMHLQAEERKADLLDLAEDNDVLFKIRRDPRVTRIGRALRRTSLDELPQLINVLRGEMSLVGPRPALPEEVERYDETARRRLSVRPGITGLWQVSGRADLDWESAVSLDLAYTDNVSIADDLRICLRTVGAVTSGRGAY